MAINKIRFPMHVKQPTKMHRQVKVKLHNIVMKALPSEGGQCSYRVECRYQAKITSITSRESHGMLQQNNWPKLGTYFSSCSR